MRVKCLGQEHNALPRPGLEPGPFDPESSALTIMPPRIPPLYRYLVLNRGNTVHPGRFHTKWIVMHWSHLRC